MGARSAALNAAPLRHGEERDAAEHKVFFGLQAQLALRGYQLRKVSGEDGQEAYAVSRWGMTRQLSTLDNVGALLQAISGERHG